MKARSATGTKASVRRTPWPPGNYRVRLMVSGMLRSGNTPIASAPTDYFFAVEAPPQPVLGLWISPTNTLLLTLQARTGLNYQIESTSTFTNWTVFTKVHAASGNTLHLLPQSTTSPTLLRVRLR